MAQFFPGSPGSIRASAAPQTGLTAETHGDVRCGIPLYVGSLANLLLRLGDNRGEIFAFQMGLAARPANDATGPDTIVTGAGTVGSMMQLDIK